MWVKVLPSTDLWQEVFCIKQVKDLTLHRSVCQKSQSKVWDKTKAKGNAHSINFYMQHIGLLNCSPAILKRSNGLTTTKLEKGRHSFVVHIFGLWSHRESYQWLQWNKLCTFILVIVLSLTPFKIPDKNVSFYCNPDKAIRLQSTPAPSFLNTALFELLSSEQNYEIWINGVCSTQCLSLSRPAEEHETFQGCTADLRLRSVVDFTYGSFFFFFFWLCSVEKFLFIELIKQ